MNNTEIYRDIATRTGGSVYVGCVGPVRTGKSTFIKRFMDTLVLPHIADEHKRERATDELPQSAAGRTIMTTEPKFIPEEAVSITLDGDAALSVRMIDCVGYVVPSAKGYIEDNAPRMVKTPWFEEEIPFNMAAEIGTQKVITEHSTIGLVITTDGSITDIPREEYAEAEERVIRELQEMHKPFAVLLNSTHPHSSETEALCGEMSERYGVPICAVDCMHMTEEELAHVLETVLLEFPVREIAVELPRWLSALPTAHPVRRALFDRAREAASGLRHLRDLPRLSEALGESEYVEYARVASRALGEGVATVTAMVKPTLFYRVLGEVTGITVEDEAALMATMRELAEVKTRFDKFRGALESVEATGYGIVMPDMTEMTLEEPEIIRQSGRYGVRLRASAPSIHLMRADIHTEVSPIVGSEKQSEELVGYLLREFEEDPSRIWDSNIFGTSLYGLVNEGLHNKLARMPDDARQKMKETVERIINEGCSGLICILV
ncbi:MAG: stage IV sporulation protein A [Ruminococcaceae bacterium]|nr:stage IV sporulation protein A [Oscillospiraceae bacterium]